ncbi:HK97-gp10 family putative phage morphogenesis protein [Erysipelothrix urinaevulpis]|uniref:HK97-gp10 family putative phage morphogenesis protein n=1 Tax=Erysipelothrix urinaevulpis TaxID=2683717 RepID=UPI00135A2CCA|nr:HK97-gp10 family putative phage morphogenesis protein [Erysipelothrix urinaevulpis]
MSVIKGLDKLTKKLAKTHKIAHDATKKGVRDKTLSTQRDAKLHAPTMHGDLMRSIKAEVRDDDNIITGKVYTKNPHAVYVEFGTGPVGEASEKVIPKGMAIQYKDKGWLVPVDFFPNYQQYGMIAIEINGELFVPTRGQKAQQFMTPASLKNKVNVGKDIGATVSKQLRKDLKK